MKTSVRIFALLFTFAALAGVIALTSSAAPNAAKPSWKITGQLEEACSCNGACPCWFGSKPTRMTCSGGQILFIQKGTYGGVPLDGLAIGDFTQSPEGKSMMESYGDWKFSYLYVDAKANPEQRAALEALGRETLVGGSSKTVEVRTVPIVRKIEGKEHSITLGQYGSFHGHLMEGGLGGVPKIVNPPMADPFHKEYEQGEAAKITYNDADQNWDFEKTNYMHNNFTVDSAEFRKFTAEMEKKMAGAAKPAGTR